MFIPDEQLDSLEQSIQMLKRVRVAREFELVQDPIEAACEWRMNDYLSLIEADYRQGWADCLDGRSNLQSSRAYIEGFEQCEDWKAREQR
jgi:hypothetical protein